jgi:uncharacterized membrane protein
MTPFLVSHIVAASTALLLGGWQIFLSRKGSPMHRLVGRTWVLLALYVAITGFFIKDLNPGHFSFFHIFSVVTLVTTTLGVLAAVRHDVKRHRGGMIGTWIGMCVAFTLAVAVPQRAIPTFALANPGDAALAVLAIMLTTAAVLAAASFVADRRYAVTPSRSM